jgi:hypothetical protein
MTKIKCITIDCNNKTYNYEIGKNNVEKIEINPDDDSINIHYNNNSNLKIPIKNIDFYNYKREFVYVEFKHR